MSSLVPGSQLGEPASGEEELDGDNLPSNWELDKLSPKHKQVAALMAQGMKNVDIAKLVGYTPEYIYVLSKQKKMKEYIAHMCEVAGTRLDALFVQSVEVIADTMANGSEAGKLKAARLQLEATKRLGRADTLTVNVNPDERLAQLSSRLVGLFQSANSELYNEDGTPKQLTLERPPIDSTATRIEEVECAPATPV